MTYTAPPGRAGLFCSLDKGTLDAAGWSAFDEMDGRLDAPEALPSGGMSLNGPFGGPWVSREETASMRLLAQRYSGSKL